MTARLAQPGKRGPKPGFIPAVNLRRMAGDDAPKAAQPEAQPAAVVHHKDPLQRSREIRTMALPDLKAYAKQIGVRQRDIDELTEDRLRQNCMLTVASLVAAYME